MGDFSLSGGVEIIGFISPTDTTDTYPVIDTLYGIDGLRNVNNLTQLNAIPNERRRSGMLVGVSGGTQYYKLNSSPWSGTTDDWSIFNTGGGTFTGNTSASCISELWVSTISGCSPITIGEANFPQGITVSGESVSTENQTEIFSTQSFNISMDTGDTITRQSFTANFKHPSGGIMSAQIKFRPSDVTSRDTITYGTSSIVHADYGTVDVDGLGLGPTETIVLTGLATGTTTVNAGWNGISFSGTVTVNSGIPPP
jgi:hypothetical protein